MTLTVESDNSEFFLKAPIRYIEFGDRTVVQLFRNIQMAIAGAEFPHIRFPVVAGQIMSRSAMVSSWARRQGQHL